MNTEETIKFIKKYNRLGVNQMNKRKSGVHITKDIREQKFGYDKKGVQI